MDALQRRSRQSACRGQLLLDPRRGRRRAVRDDRIPGPPNTPAGQEAGWRIVAPTGTRITRLTVQYYLGQTSAGEWLPFIRTAGGSRPAELRPARRTDDLRTGRDALLSVWSGRLLHRRYRGLGRRRTMRSPERAVRHRSDAPSRVGRALRCSRPGDRHLVANDPGDERRTMARRIPPRHGEPRDQCHRQHRHSCDASPGRRSGPHN